MDWADVAQPQSPADNATLTYPQPLLLDWTSVQGSPQYQLTISSSDPQQGVNQITGSPITTSATAYAIPTRLSDGEYWWQVTPIDAEGNEGTPSPWFTFNWSWPTDTTLTLNDLDPSAQVFDPQFSWTRGRRRRVLQGRREHRPELPERLERVLLRRTRRRRRSRPPRCSRRPRTTTGA